MIWQYTLTKVLLNLTIGLALLPCSQTVSKLWEIRDRQGGLTDGLTGAEPQAKRPVEPVLGRSLLLLDF
jgi:hypothetical protein